VNAAHDELKHDAAAYALGSLEPAERAAFEVHLATCAECTADVKQLRLSAGALARAVPQVSPPPSLRAKVLGQVTASPGALTPAPAAVVRDTRGLPAWLQIAALLVVGAGMFAYAQRMQARVSNLEAQLAQAQAQVASSDRLIADARNVAFRAQAAMGVFAAPDVARIDLAGQPVAVAVTLEPAGGVPAPTGERYLIGTPSPL
jgi:anti-sigma-K factor RskA